MKLAKLTSEVDKYEYLIASLPSEILGKVYDLFDVQPPIDPYTTLVRRIEIEFQPTETEQIQKLLRGLERGDKKPSSFLPEMHDLAKDRVTDTVLKELFLAQLPEVFASILSVSAMTNLDAMAAGADSYWAREKSEKTTIASATVFHETLQPASSTDAKMDALMGKMVEVL